MNSNRESSIGPEEVEQRSNGGDQATGKARGGLARADKLSSEERKAIARRAAEVRWSGDLPQATHEGEFPIGDSVIGCAVLEDGRRIITQATILRVIGRARSPKAGTGVFSTADGLPFFLQAEILRPFIDDDLLASTKPIFYCSKSGGRGVGYDAELLPKVCEVYLRLRDDQSKSASVVKRYADIVAACDILMRGLARVGIAALVDEATGYQEVRDRNALQQILDTYIGRELAKWVRTFPEEFYQEIFRLKGWDYRIGTTKRPMQMARLTADLVYARLAPGVLDELRRLTPKDQRGRRKHKLFQRLTIDVGHPALKDHISGITYLAKANDAWEGFYRAVNRVSPQFGKTMLLPLGDESKASADN